MKKQDILLAFLLLAAAAAYLTISLSSVPAFSALEAGEKVYVIDAGHGGEDGGAVSKDGTAESGINLAIAHYLNDLLLFLGEETRMTRTEDVSIYSDGAKTLHEKKASDLKNRVEIVNETGGGILVSIHQNSMPNAVNVHGAQIFYREGGEELARSVQDALNRTINENEKTVKRISSDIYLMNHVEKDAILIECGFLSNHAECAMLKQADYQKKLAVVIAAGLLSSAQ